MSGLTVIEPEPHGANVVAILQEALELAQAGKLSSVALALVYRDGCVGQLWSEMPSFGLLIGAVARLEHHLNEKGAA